MGTPSSHEKPPVFTVLQLGMYEQYGIFKKYRYFFQPFVVYLFVGGRRSGITLEKILKFSTGSEYEPLLGFTLHPTLAFQVLPGHLPTANTCSNRLTLPIAESPLTMFPSQTVLFEKFDYAFANEYFGIV